MLKLFAAALVALFLGTASAAASSITLFSEHQFNGESVTLRRDVDNFAQYPPWNDRAVSLVVNSGTWEICKHAGYRDCAIVRGGQVADLGHLGFYRQISSIRALDSFGRNDRRHRDPWDDRWDDRRHYEPRHPGWGPGWGGGGWDRPRERDRIIWDDERRHGGGHPAGNLSRCQSRVYQGFVERYGYQARAQFYGASDEGTVWWDGEAWRFSCTGGRVHIWQ